MSDCKRAKLIKKSLRNFAKCIRRKHLIFIELFGMDESSFEALILLVPKNYDLVRKSTPMNRHYFFCELLFLQKSSPNIARIGLIELFHVHLFIKKSLNFYYIFTISSGFLSLFLRFMFTKEKMVYIGKYWLHGIFIELAQPLLRVIF